MIGQQPADGLGAGRGVGFLGNEGVEGGKERALNADLNGST